MLITTVSENALKTKIKLFFCLPPTLRGFSQELLPDCFLSRTTQIMYVLENVSLQLKHQTSVLANSNGKIWQSKRCVTASMLAVVSLPFWRQLIYSQTGQICFVMHWSIALGKWVSNFQGNSPIFLTRALTGPPQERIIKQTSVYFLSVNITTASEVGTDMKDLPALPEPTFWGCWD